MSLPIDIGPVPVCAMAVSPIANDFSLLAWQLDPIATALTPSTVLLPPIAIPPSADTVWERPAAKASPPETLVEFPNINDVSIPLSIELFQPIIPHPDPSSVLPSPEIKLVS